MKKTLLLALFASAGLIGTSASALATDGTINITGLINGTTCSVHGDSGVSPDADIAVVLPTTQISGLGGVGSAFGGTGYNIVVGATGETACTDGLHASVHYDSNSVMIDPTTGNLKNKADAPGTTTPVFATGLQVQIADASNNTPINLFTPNANSTPVIIAGNTAKLPFTASYFRTGEVTSGQVSTAVQYSVTVN